jgi:hypothetical protein
MANDFHLGERGRRQDGPEEPEDPCHNRGHIYEKLVRLAENVRVSRPRKRWEAHEELGVVALEYARNLRRCRFRVCGAAAEADTLVVYLTGSFNPMLRCYLGGAVLTMNLNHLINGFKIN